MLLIKPYDRTRAVEYAKRWAFGRNPLFSVYDGLGGDCTNFVSQSVYAGSCVMNYTPVFGWYYINGNERSAAWTGVEYFYNFITRDKNKGVGDNIGPFGVEVGDGALENGDVIQLGNRDGVWYHTLIVTGFAEGTYLVSAHSNDALDRPLDSYDYYRARFIKIGGVYVNIALDGFRDCFPGLINGTSLTPDTSGEPYTPNEPDNPDEPNVPPQSDAETDRA